MSEARGRTNLPVYDSGVVRFASTGQFLSLYGKSLHRGAVAVYHDAPLEPLKPFSVEIEIPEVEHPVAAEVQVVSARPGMYLFQLLDPGGEVGATLDRHAGEIKNALSRALFDFVEGIEGVHQQGPATRPAAEEDVDVSDLAGVLESAPAAPAPEAPSAIPAERTPPGIAPPPDIEAGPAAATAAALPMPAAAVPIATDEVDFALPTTPIQPPAGNIAEVVGIDFGQSYTGAAVGIDEGVFMVPDATGRRLFPTIISYPGKGTPLVSWAARKRLASHAHQTVSSVKRLLGRNFSDPLIAGHLHGLPYRSKPGPNDSILLEIESAQYAIPQICADILRYLRQSLSERLGFPVRKAVFTHPVVFSDQQRQALTRAAQMAGFEVAGLVEEPVAVALAYGYGQSKNEIVAVYDFGGGTFDFTILDVSIDSERVLASKGDSWLGGDDFDLVMAQAIANKFWRDTQVELQKNAVEWQRLLHACESAKQYLTEHEEIRLVLREVSGAPVPVDLVQHMRRPGFELIAASLFEQTIEICQAALDSIGFEPRDITQLVVSGGTSRVPFIREGLSRFFERPIDDVVHPQQAVALGAGVAAARICQHGARTAHSS